MGYDVGHPPPLHSFCKHVQGGCWVGYIWPLPSRNSSSSGDNSQEAECTREAGKEGEGEDHEEGWTGREEMFSGLFIQETFIKLPD